MRDQGNFEIKMMAFLWFHQDITPHRHKHVELDIQQSLVRTPRKTLWEPHLKLLRTRDHGTKRRWFSYAPCMKTPVFRGTSLTSSGSLDRDSCFRWKVHPLVACPGLSQLASITRGATWVLKRKKIRQFLSQGLTSICYKPFRTTRDARRRASQGTVYTKAINQQYQHLLPHLSPNLCCCCCVLCVVVLLVVGCWLLVVGCWLLVVGCWLLVVVVVEWLYYSKRIIIVRGADLSDFFRWFLLVKCVLLFHGPMTIVTCLRKKTWPPKTGCWFSSGKRHIPKQNHGNRRGF